MAAESSVKWKKSGQLPAARNTGMESDSTAVHSTWMPVSFSGYSSGKFEKAEPQTLRFRLEPWRRETYEEQCGREVAYREMGWQFAAVLGDYRIYYTRDPGAPELPEDVAEQVEISVKYEGYIRRQEKQVEELRQLEKHRLPPDMEYSHIQGLRLEAREKLAAVRPLDLGQASRISGVSPADIAALMIWLHTRTERGDAT